MKNAKETIVLTLCLSLIFSSSAVFAAPQGGKVVGGSAHIRQSGATTTINQNSDRAIINWHSFDIGKNEAVRHNMPSRNSAGLHRVVGGGRASQIQGLLQSNGNVYLVNPAGVVIHRGARVDTNGFIATTRDIADSNFMKGNMVFDRPGRPDAQIVNQGSISVGESGLAALVAPTVRNEGLIAGKLGKVALASGDATWKLDMHGDDLITFTVNEKDVNALHTPDGTPLAAAENSGSIKAEGGVVVLTAAQLDGIVGSVVNSGEVSAASAEFKGGKITFRGEGSEVDVRNTGTVDVSSARADGGEVRMVTDGAVTSYGAVVATGGQKGGKAVLTGREVALTGNARIDVSGAVGGGTALVGGNALGKGPERNARTAKVESGATIHADAKVKGDGGQVVVWSNEKTSFDGTITARGGSESGNGGQVETSGKSLKIGNTAKVDASAPKGIHGEWLLDPEDFIVAADKGDITGSKLSESLELNDVTISSVTGNASGSGDIFVNDGIAWRSDNRLTLDALRNIYLGANIDIYGDATSVNMRTGNNGMYLAAGGKLTFYGKNPQLFISGKAYKLLRTIEDIKNISNDYLGLYALANDIDASETRSWNGGKGFKPIGQYFTESIGTGADAFKGELYGCGHVISNLFINRPDEDYVGLFSYVHDYQVTPKIIGLGLVDADVRGRDNVGILAGEFGWNWNSKEGRGILKNCFTTGKVDGRNFVGGMTGFNGGKIDQSFSLADVSGIEYVGGLVGKNVTYIGDSFSEGSVKGNTNIGGFAGAIEEQQAIFIGVSVNGIYRSYSSGHVEGCGNTGGFIGNMEKQWYNAYPTVRGCYWNIDTSGRTTSPAGKGLTNAQIEKQTSLLEFDFSKVWEMTDNKGPRLAWVNKIFANKDTSGGNTGNQGSNIGNAGAENTSGMQTGNSLGTVLPDVDDVLAEKNNESTKWNEKHLLESIQCSQSNKSDQKNFEYDSVFDEKIFEINESAFQNAKKHIGGSEYLMEANIETLKKRLLQTIFANAISEVTIAGVKNLDVVNNIKNIDSAGKVVTDGGENIAVIYKNAKSGEPLDIKKATKNVVNAVLNDSRLADILQDTILTYILSSISKKVYINATLKEKSHMTKDEIIEVLEDLRISAALNALAESYSKEQVKYYKKIQTLRNADPVLQIIYNTLEMTTEYADNLRKKITFAYKTNIDPVVKNVAKEILEVIIEDIFGKVMGNINTAHFSYTDMVKNAVSKVDINTLTEKLISKSPEQKKIKELMDIVLEDMSIIMSDRNVQYINSQIERVNAL